MCLKAGLLDLIEQHRLLYDEFADILARQEFADHLQGNKLAVACSGGADSLALSLLLQHWCRQSGKELIALIVDHGLRAESAAEAESVRDQLAKSGIAAEILSADTDDMKDGSGGLQARARVLRYGLLADYCVRHSIGSLFVAHHLQDQAETFLLRLRRGSHIKGLGCMDYVSQVGGVTVLRPLLGVNVNDLRALVTDSGLSPVADPSNECDDFERVRMRKLLPVLAEVGLDAECFATTAERMRLADDFIEAQAAVYIRQLRKSDDGCIVGSRDLWRDSHELLHYVLLSHIWRCLGNGNPPQYPPRGRSLERLSGLIVGVSDCQRVLAGVKMVCHGNEVTFARLVGGEGLEPPTLSV